jgi:hypothetical protein
MAEPQVGVGEECGTSPVFSLSDAWAILRICGFGSLMFYLSHCADL